METMATTNTVRVSNWTLAHAAEEHELRCIREQSGAIIGNRLTEDAKTNSSATNDRQQVLAKE
jgi:hypothetical protein